MDHLEEMGIDVVKLTPWSSGKKSRLTDKGLKMMSSTSCAGLQFKAVIYIWGDMDPPNFDDIDRNSLIYVACTRAEELLLILHSRETDHMEAVRQSISETA
jgi:superfamily I DNA/RNA helicase